MKCSRCGNRMIDSHTTFTVVKDRMVFVTESVPCLECSVCGHIVIRQDVVRKLETLSSGRAVPSSTYKAWVYRWGEPHGDIDAVLDARTEDLALSVAVSGTTL